MKIPSGEITNYPYLKRIGATGKKIILSTGMSTLDEVREAVKVLRENGAREIVLLHCNTEYPTPVSYTHLKTDLGSGSLCICKGKQGIKEVGTAGE